MSVRCLTEVPHLVSAQAKEACKCLQVTKFHRLLTTPEKTTVIAEIFTFLYFVLLAESTKFSRI